MRLMILVLSFLFSGLIFAQEATQAAAALPYDQFFAFLFENIGGFKGASSMAIAVLVAQILLKLFETKVGELIGAWKMAIVALLTLVVGVLGMAMSTNVSIVTALFSSANLVLLQGFAHQVYKQVVVKKD